jgi:membrane-bound lytic murein transglycosylase B
MPYRDRRAASLRESRPRTSCLRVSGFAGLLVAFATLPLGGCIATDAFAERSVSNNGVQYAARSTPVVEENTVRPADFRQYVESLWPTAQARGVTRATFDSAFSGVTPDAEVVRLTKRQSEFVRPIWDYIDGAVSAQRLSLGEQAARRHASTLDAVERAYGVPKSVVLGVWGMETNFGSYTGSKDVIRSLATLAHEGYRGNFFRDELLTALEILQQGKINRRDMKGSWAGAMGHTQFMPTSYMKYAVDGDGDGRRDIWNSIPDALASTANYLREHGWRTGLPWGVEVTLPSGFDFTNQEAAFSRWASLGLRRAGGGNLPQSGDAKLFLPAGASGPAFLVTHNFDVIKRYNSSDAYAKGVAQLGDRLTGGRGIQGSWPRNEPMLDATQRREVQDRLAALGHYSGKTDGMFGTMTREAVRQFQLQRGMTADGYANVAVLNALRQAR